MTTALHLGELHAYEQWLVALIAFGPFVVLGIVVYAVRRRDTDDEQPARGSGDEQPARGSGDEQQS